MAYRRSAAKRHGRGNDGSFWLSFSDLMSSLVLIIVLVLFYIIYQYFNLAEINEAEIARRQFQLDQAQAALNTQQDKLTEAEKQMIAQQILLNGKEEELQSAQEILNSQEEQLSAAQNQLDEKEAEIASAQSQLDALSSQLSDKQQEIDAQEAQLSAAQSQLAQQQSQLVQQQDQLAQQQSQLTQQRDQLALQQSQLTTAQSQLDDKEAQIAAAQNQLQYQQNQLSAAQSQLTQQQNQLSAAQTQLTSQQSQLEYQQTQLENQQAQIEQLVGMKTRIISSLSEAFRNSSISATVDPANGSIALESDVLFQSARYELTERGKRFVDQVLPVYLNVLFSDEYRPYVAEVIIEGHTDSDGEWLSNLALSQQRALAVAHYALGDCRALSADAKNELKKVVTVNGRSYSDRIFNGDGTENKDASRRVVFKFRLTDEEMIRQLQAILEAH